MDIDYSPIKYLDLRQPLQFSPIEALPSPLPENDEFLLCFKLNPSEAANIEPERDKFIIKTVFIGKRMASGSIFLPVGHYIFTQNRRETPLSQDEWLDIAIELQKDGLWERNKLGNLLYVRYLYEDGMFVTQIFRDKN